MKKYNLKSKRININGELRWIVSYPTLGQFYAFAETFPQAVENLNEAADMYIVQLEAWGLAVPREDYVDTSDHSKKLPFWIKLLMTVIIVSILTLLISLKDSTQIPFKAQVLSVVEMVDPSVKELSLYAEKRYNEVSQLFPKVMVEDIHEVSYCVRPNHIPSGTLAWYKPVSKDLCLTPLGTSDYVIAHEIGHHIFHKYKVSESDLWEEIFEKEWKLKNNYGSTSKSEAFAESVSIYITSPKFISKKEIPESMKFVEFMVNKYK